jgi:hypothetical protein
MCDTARKHSGRRPDAIPGRCPEHRDRSGHAYVGAGSAQPSVRRHPTRWSRCEDHQRPRVRGGPVRRRCRLRYPVCPRRPGPVSDGEELASAVADCRAVQRSPYAPPSPIASIATPTATRVSIALTTNSSPPIHALDSAGPPSTSSVHAITALGAFVVIVLTATAGWRTVRRAPRHQAGDPRHRRPNTWTTRSATWPGEHVGRDRHR